MRQSRPASGRGFQVKVLKKFEVVPGSLGSGLGERVFVAWVTLAGQNRQLATLHTQASTNEEERVRLVEDDEAHTRQGYKARRLITWWTCFRAMAAMRSGVCRLVRVRLVEGCEAHTLQGYEAHTIQVHVAHIIQS